MLTLGKSLFTFSIISWEWCSCQLVWLLDGPATEDNWYKTISNWNILQAWHQMYQWLFLLNLVQYKLNNSTFLLWYQDI
jgi:hypothetical protein